MAKNRNYKEKISNMQRQQNQEVTEGTEEETLAPDETPVEVEEVSSIEEDEDTNIVEEIGDEVDAIVEEVEEHTEPVKEEVKKVIKSGRYQVVVVDNGAPLHITKVVKKLKALGINYDFNENTNTIVTNTFPNKEDAIICKKYLVGKGLRPTIKEL